MQLKISRIPSSPFPPLPTLPFAVVRPPVVLDTAFSHFSAFSAPHGMEEEESGCFPYVYKAVCKHTKKQAKKERHGGGNCIEQKKGETKGSSYIVFLRKKKSLVFIVAAQSIVNGRLTLPIRSCGLKHGAFLLEDNCLSCSLGFAAAMKGKGRQWQYWILLFQSRQGSYADSYKYNRGSGKRNSFPPPPTMLFNGTNERHLIPPSSLPFQKPFRSISPFRIPLPSIAVCVCKT